MSKRGHRGNSRTWLAACVVFASISSCGSDVQHASRVKRDGARGSACSVGTDCRSGVCTNSVCVGNGRGAPAGSACSDGPQCASGLCVNGKCAAGSALPDGSSCAKAEECSGGVCSDGVCTGDGSAGSGGASDAEVAGESGNSGASGGTGQSGGTSSSGGSLGSAGASGSGNEPTTTVGPLWPGAGDGFQPLTPGCGPDTAAQCTGECAASSTVIQAPSMNCFICAGDPTPNDPAAVVEQVVENVDSISYVHLRVTLDPALIDVSFGAGSCCGWADRTHKFDELKGGDHAELSLLDTDGLIVMKLNLDLISDSDAFACGFGTLGVSDQEGKVVEGDPTWVLASATSISRNLNGCGYCLSEACAPSGDCAIDSPATDDGYAPNPLTPAWDYRQVYEVWIASEAFGAAGFGRANVTRADASPSKIDENSLIFMPAPCPPEWQEDASGP